MTMPTLAETQLKELTAWLAASSQDARTPLGNDFIWHDAYGSGRTGHKQKAEHCRSLDVNKMRREGCLEPGWSGNWVWSRDGQEVARISGRAEHCRIILSYSVRQNGSDWEPITQTVNTTQSDCNYGGQRTYFLCPGVVNGRHCGRRVGKLFSGGRYFLCRHCYQILYIRRDVLSV